MPLGGKGLPATRESSPGVRRCHRTTVPTGKPDCPLVTLRVTDNAVDCCCAYTGEKIKDVNHFPTGFWLSLVLGPPLHGGHKAPRVNTGMSTLLRSRIRLNTDSPTSKEQNTKWG